MAALVVPPLLARRQARQDAERRALRLPPRDLLADSLALAREDAAADDVRRIGRETALVVPESRALMNALPDPASAADGVPVAAYDRIVRLVSWVVILGASVFVATVGFWQQTQ